MVLLRVGPCLAGFLSIVAMASPAAAQEWLSPKPLNQSQPAQQRQSPQPQQSQQRPQQRPPQQAPAQQQAQQQAGQQAAPALVEEIGDWRIQCFTAPSRLCQVQQRQVNPQTQVMVLWIEMTLAVQPKPSTLLAVMVPLGVRIAPALNLAADKSPMAALPILTCVPAGCLHQAEVNNNSVALMQKAQAVTSQVSDVAGRAIPLNVSMRGFREAYAKAGEFLRAR